MCNQYLREAQLSPQARSWGLMLEQLPHHPVLIIEKPGVRACLLELVQAGLVSLLDETVIHGESILWVKWIAPQNS